MESLYKNLPDTPGVYLMRDSAGELLYVGKAGNLKRRVSSYFLRAHDARIQKLVSQIAKVEYKKTDSALEALILEAELIKEFSPPFNIKNKDGKSFLYVEITKERFPRVLLVRGREARNDADLHADKRGRGAMSHESGVMGYYGPFTSASSAREALRILRRIFPWSVHTDPKLRITSESTNKNSRHSHAFADSHRDSRRRPCFDYEMGLCPGTCIGAVTREEYMKTIKNLKLFLEGKKRKVARNLEKEMAVASKRLEFEKAEKLRRQIFTLQHIRDTALINESDGQLSNVSGQMFRIEGYDISNISGTSAVGSMVVFTNGEPDKNEYRKFRIKTVVGSNPARHALSEVGGDVGMLKGVLRRRFSRSRSKTVARSRTAKQSDQNGHPEPAEGSQVSSVQDVGSFSPLRMTPYGVRLPHSPPAGGSLAMTKEDSHAWPLPHLILIDGGRGQVNAAKAVLLEVGLKIPVIGIAKGAKRKRNDFIGFVPKRTDKRTLVRVRDEAHRFAIGYHKQVRGREFLTK